MATTTGFVQRVTLITGSRIACVWVGPAANDAELLWVQMRAGDSDASIQNKRSLIAFLTEAQYAGRQVDVTHPDASTEISAASTTFSNLSTTPLQLDAIEVTQGIQDLAQSIPLLAGKRTVVRVYLSHYSNPGITVRGEISVRQGPSDAPFVVPSDNSVVLDPADAGNIAAKRNDVTRSLNFVLPHASEGPLRITLTSVTNAVTSAAVSFGSERQPAIWFHPTGPMRVRVLGIRYTQDGVAHVPTPIDYALLLSWLMRAYPTGQVISTTGVVDGAVAAPFGCGDVNAQVAAIRALDVAAGGDERTHYYGLVSDAGFFMRGCAAGIPSSPSPSTVASGPTGPATWGWDVDGSYGDWYGGHELGHTYGRRHPGFCGETQSDLENYPFDNGQLANSDASFAGFDVGDPVNGLPMAALRGTQWHDVMTYCNFQWLSAYTYLGVRRRLADEDSLGAGGGAGAAGFGAGGRPDERFPHKAVPRESEPGHRGEPAAAPVGEVVVSVVATVNLTKRTGRILYVNPLERLIASDRERSGPAVLRVKGVGDKVLRETPVPVRLNSELRPGEDQVGIVDAVLRVDASTRAIELVLDGQTADSYAVGGALPSLRALRVVEGAAKEITIVTDAEQPVERGQTYSVQVSTDDGQTWQAIAVGLKRPALDLDRSQFRAGQEVRVRVVATNGLQRSVVMSETVRM
jgi:hypothetical protein